MNRNDYTKTANDLAAAALVASLAVKRSLQTKPAAPGGTVYASEVDIARLSESVLATAALAQVNATLAVAEAVADLMWRSEGLFPASRPATSPEMEVVTVENVAALPDKSICLDPHDNPIILHITPTTGARRWYTTGWGDMISEKDVTDGTCRILHRGGTPDDFR